MADQTETGIWKMRGKVTLTPGAGHHADRTGACCYRFGFVNVTGDDICDLTITSSNLDALERAREILADTEPKPMKPGVKIWRVVYKANKNDKRPEIVTVGSRLRVIGLATRPRSQPLRRSQRSSTMRTRPRTSAFTPRSSSTSSCASRTVFVRVT